MIIEKTNADKRYPYEVYICKSKITLLCENLSQSIYWGLLAIYKNK